MEKIKWIGTLIVIFGICLTSYNVYPLNLYFGLFGSFLWSLVGYLKKDNPLFVVEIFAVFVYILGLINFYKN